RACQVSKLLVRIHAPINQDGLIGHIGVDHEHQNSLDHVFRLPNLPTGIRVTSSLSAPGRPGSIPVSAIKAGATALTVTPCGASEEARECISPSNPAFEAA